MRRRLTVWPLVCTVTMMVAGMLADVTALAATGHAGRSGGGGGRASGSSPSPAGRSIASAAAAHPTAPTQRATIQACPTGSPPGCPPWQGTTGCRRYCQAHGFYVFGHYSFFDEYWFGQYPYTWDTYAAAYQPQIAPDSYYEGTGQQWGKDLKAGTVPQERLVALIQVQMLNIPKHSQKAFRRGFLAGYGSGGDAVLAQIIKQAREITLPKPVNKPSVEGKKSGSAK